MKEEKPESEFCYESSLFREGKHCPDLDDTIIMEPKCKKYGKGLSWNVSGRILKCEECLQGEEIKKGRSQKIEECYVGCILALQGDYFWR